MKYTAVSVRQLDRKGKPWQARAKYKDLKDKYQDISDKYGVPLNYLISFWAIETHFGYNKGKYHLIDGLTNLSYKNRRAKFFKKELYNVLLLFFKHNLHLINTFFEFLQTFLIKCKITLKNIFKIYLTGTVISKTAYDTTP